MERKGGLRTQPPNAMFEQNQNSFVLCLIGGAMLIAANYYGATWDLLVGIYIIVHSFLLPEVVFWIIDLILVALWLISWLGGIAVIFGGGLLTTRRVGTGKIIIAVAAGFGLISFIVTLAWILLTMGLGGLLLAFYAITHSLVFMGLVLSIIARTIAKSPR
jgi:hypothetical protein